MLVDIQHVHSWCNCVGAPDLRARQKPLSLSQHTENTAPSLALPTREGDHCTLTAQRHIMISSQSTANTRMAPPLVSPVSAVSAEPPM